MGGGKKRVKQFFQKHKNSAIKKCWEKIAGKSVKKVFLYSHAYCDEKMGETKRPKQFFQKHNNSASKKCCGKKSSEKKCEKHFFIFTRIS